MDPLLSIKNIERVAEKLRDYTVVTPSHRWSGLELQQALGENETEVYIKLELFQHTGTFKPRGALNCMLDLSREALARGVTAVSAGNHAIAVAYAAQKLGSSAKVVMTKTANPLRVELTRQYGAEVVLEDSVQAAFARVDQIASEEKRTFVHPFDGPLTLQGTATVGLEFGRQVPEIDAMILPIGGGGLCGGFATALKQIWPAVRIYGVEPVGANAMTRSIAQGSIQSLSKIDTLADSLAPPTTTPYTFEVCREVLDDIVQVDDDQLVDAMRLMMRGVKLAVEPAGAATTAALVGPLKERLRGKRIGIIACGANISPQDFSRLISQASAIEN